MNLAWLSANEPVRDVAGIWRSLSAQSRREAAIEDLLHGASITGAAIITTAMFFQSVYQTGLELKALFPGIPEPRPLWDFGRRDNIDVGIDLEMDGISLEAAFEHALMRDEPLKLLREPAKYRRRLNHLLAVWKAEAGGYAAKMRWGLRLTQAQFADLFMADLRTVQRWMAHEERPTLRHRWFLRLFQLFVREHGLRTFRRRFITRFTQPACTRSEIRMGSC